MNFKNERKTKKAFYSFIILISAVFILILLGVIFADDNLLKGVTKPPADDPFKNFNTLTSDQQSGVWRDFVNLKDRAQQESLWASLSPEKQKEVLTKISQGKFSYLYDFKGLGENVQKSILKNNMGSIVGLLIKNDISVFDKQDVFTKYPNEVAAGFDDIFKKSDESAKSDAGKLFYGEKAKVNGVTTQNNFLSNKQKEDLFNKLDVKTQEGLLMKMSDEYFKGFKNFPNGKSPKLESVSLEQGAKYRWVDNKFGIDDGKGNLKAWVDFNDFPPQMKNLKFEKGVFEATLNSGRVISFNGGSVNQNGKPVRPNGKILGGSKRELSLINGIAENEKNQIDIRYDDQGFAKISLSGNEENTVLVGKDSMGHDFWFTQFHMDDKNEKGEVVKDTSSAEIEIAPNDDMRAKNAIIYGSFGRKVTSKTGFTEIGSSGLLGGDKWSEDRIKEVVGDTARNLGTSIASISNTIAELSSSGKAPSSAQQADKFVPELEKEATPVVSTPSGYPLTSSVGFDKSSEKSEGVFNVEYGPKGFRITDEGRGYGVLDITKAAFPVDEVKIRSDRIVSNEADVSGRAVSQHYLIDGNTVLRFGKDATYIERSFENAAVPINRIVNENLKDKNGNNFALVLDNSQGKYELYIDQKTPGLTDDQKVTDKTTFTTTAVMKNPRQLGTRRGSASANADLLQIQISDPATPGNNPNSPDVEIRTLDSSSAATQLLGPLGRRFGVDQAISTATQKLSSGLASNDPAQQILGQAQETIDSQVSQIREVAKSFGYSDLKSFSDAMLKASDDGLKIGGYTTNPLNLGADTKEALAFIGNYDAEMQKFAEFKKQATLQGLGTGYFNIRSSTGTLESNGATLTSPFIAKQIAKNIASNEGINRLNIMIVPSDDPNGKPQIIPKSSSSVSTVRSYGGTSYGTSSGGTQIYSGQSTQTQTTVVPTQTTPPVDVLNIQIPGINTGCSGGRCNGGVCNGGNCN